MSVQTAGNEIHGHVHAGTQRSSQLKTFRTLADNFGGYAAPASRTLAICFVLQYRVGPRKLAVGAWLHRDRRNIIFKIRFQAIAVSTRTDYQVPPAIQSADRNEPAPDDVFLCRAYL
jgi:hypothetical protein